MNDMTRSTREGRSVDPSQGVAWWTEAWGLFMKNPGMWVVFGLIFFIGYLVLSFVPVLGHLATALLTPVLIGGWMMAARKCEEGGKLEVPDLFAGFKDLVSPLLVLGAAVLVCQLAVMVLMMVLGLGAAASLVGGSAMHSSAGMAAGFGLIGLAGLLALLFGLVIAMLLWFAPALVVFEGIPPLDALKISAQASLRNIVPFLLFAVISFVVSIVLTITVVGILVLVPLGFLTMYVSYKGVFGR
jgi:uncharacterized membrane protein